MALLNRVAEIRKAKGWSRPVLAREMGTSTEQVARLEKGQRRLSDVWMERLAGALGVAPHELISETDLPNEDELQEMIELALQAVPLGVPREEQTRIVAGHLRAQLEQFRAGAEVPDTAD